MGQVQPCADKNSPSSPQSCGLLRYFESPMDHSNHRRIIPFCISNAYENSMNLTPTNLDYTIKPIKPYQIPWNHWIPIKSPWHSPLNHHLKRSFFSFEEPLAPAFSGAAEKRRCCEDEASVPLREKPGRSERKCRKNWGLWWRYNGIILGNIMRYKWNHNGIIMGYHGP